MPPWDVLASDEAHRTAGNLPKPWALLLATSRSSPTTGLVVAARERNAIPSGRRRRRRERRQGWPGALA
ncbi:hypothetical protein O3Q52_12125 [Streptomyces sp. ActVer]|uniref:hypothetical protein n=1 Tax=Streptomyces sp. ActVer TaxID=3014558 RepID=UPI0022B442B8|nr:hypothetical protein [Streptomyces sp. ActVer]MCZ4508940.1 hypothetical protein [Streptomyces sp. ActVer]